MKKLLLLLVVSLFGCTRMLHSFEYTFEKLPPHPSSLILQQQVEIISAAGSTRFEAALESAPQEITFVVFSSLGPRAFLLRETDYLAFIERSRLYHLPVSDSELRNILHQFLSSYVHARQKEIIEVQSEKGLRIIFRNSTR